MTEGTIYSLVLFHIATEVAPVSFVSVTKERSKIQVSTYTETNLIII